MNRPLRHWHPETTVCSLRRHVTPAANVARLRPEDAGLGVDLPDGRRLARCIRCDVWLPVMPPRSPTSEILPPLAELDVPRRGRPLRDAIVLRLIALDRAIHAVVFGLLAWLLIYVELHLGGLQHGANSLLTAVQRALGDTGQQSSRDFLVRQLSRVLNLKSSTLAVLAGSAVAYCAVEAVEAVGLWMEQRWAEYLTAIATAGFLPFEIKALVDRVTVLRVVALVLNVAILVWLLWRKKLFGLNGGYRPQEESFDRRELFGAPGMAEQRAHDVEPGPAPTPAPAR
jgi:uncharacterized membrane protein (DUF2068 family)